MNEVMWTKPTTQCYVAALRDEGHNWLEERQRRNLTAMVTGARRTLCIRSLAYSTSETEDLVIGQSPPP